MSDDDPASCPFRPGGDGGNEDEESPGSPLDDEMLSYGSYLKIPELLSLQDPESDPPAHDELLFITIHQAYELWFKEIIFELEGIRELLRQEDIYEASRLVERVVEIEDLLVQQIHILETMRPRDFLSFRAALQPASGFQSVQFREVEFLSGVGRPEVLEFVEMDEEEAERLERRRREPSLRRTFYETLQSLGFEVAIPNEEGFDDEEARETTSEALTTIYSNPRDHFHVYQLAENLVEHDQHLLMWRYHHVRVVERLIGTKSGTGGSPGVEYLESTLDQRAYPLLWHVRGELDDEQFYGIDPMSDLDR